MELQISFIIPLYNCETLVARCLDSIFGTGVDAGRYEVIVVDDGSTDGSVAIVDAYAADHPNLVLVRQQNAGASAARNTGLRQAKGQYIWFVDADDRIVPDCFRKVVDRLDKGHSPEVLCFNYQEAMPENLLDRKLFDTEEMMTGVDYFRRIGNTYLWNKVMRRDRLRHEFLDGTKNLEDLYFCLQNILPCDCIETLPLFGYYYDHTNQTSTSLNRSAANLRKLSDDTMTIQRHILDDIPNLSAPCQEICRDTVNQTVAGHLFSLMSYYPVSRLREVIRTYRQWKVYPIRRVKGNRRMHAFVRLANCYPLLILAAMLKNRFRKQ